MSDYRIEVPFGAQNLVIESGKFAKLANGSVTLSLGGTIVLVTVCVAKEARKGIDFFPLMVEYQEKTYSAGRIPGGFFKREGRPTQKEILTSRLIDRPIRPLFPDGFFKDVQIVATVLSSDGENDPDVVALVGASAALMISDIPFPFPLAGVRVGLKEDQFVINPTFEEREEMSMDFIIAGHEGGVVMLEGEAQQVSEEKVLEAIKFGHQALLPLIKVQHELKEKIGKPKVVLDVVEPNPKLEEKVKALAAKGLTEVYSIADKDERQKAKDELVNGLTQDLAAYDDCKVNDEDEISASDIKGILETMEYNEVRRLIFEESKRADGRGLKDIRPLACEVGILPRTHGVGLFTRGQTQSLSVVTLGSKKDEQLVEALEGTSYKNFMLHYNFPSFSVGETRPMRGPGRREIGHGALAAKAIKAVLPVKDDFPYTVRIVSEILESNGSSSMATVCAASLSLMDAGVPIKDAVAGISIGLISDDKKPVLLTDIMGLEDHYGDMDFKVAGTKSGITAMQVDLKVDSINFDLIEKALFQAKEARVKILDTMKQTIAEPRKDLSEYAPRILICSVPQEKIGELIGPGGKTIKKIIEATGVESIDIDEDGKVFISSPDSKKGEEALGIVTAMMEEPVVGKSYNATVKRIMNFGAFCEFLPGKEGLVHVSELDNEYVKDCNEYTKVGDKFRVKILEIDKMGRFNLSKKQAE